MRKPLVAGNWKMNTTGAAGRELLGQLKSGLSGNVAGIDILVCPPFPYLSASGSVIEGSAIQLGAQDVYFEQSGAFTGEVAVEMLVDVGCRFVILGHSERRHVIGETDTLINKKMHAALAGGLSPILCVGELLSERENGRTESVLDAQMDGGLAGIDADAMQRVVIAYEPVWAIGTGVTATPDQAESAHAHLRDWLSARYNATIAGQTRILYGGSVKPDNAAELIALPNVDGALVGGASLKSEQFLPIIAAAADGVSQSNG